MQVPKELLANESIEEFTVEANGKKFKFKRKYLTWYEQEVILQKSSVLKREKGKKKKKYVLNLPEFNLNLMKKSLIEAPFKINEKNLKKLSKETKDQIKENLEFERITKEQEKK